MCRAVYAVVIGADEASAARLRRAAGLEVQVMELLTDAAATPSGPFDVVIVDGATPGAADAVGRFRAATYAAIVWVGEDPPDEAHIATPDDDALADALPGAVVRALLARRG